MHKIYYLNFLYLIYVCNSQINSPLTTATKPNYKGYTDSLPESILQNNLYKKYN